MAGLLPSPSMRLRDARYEDARLLWEWRNDQVTRTGFRNTAPVAWEEHLAWLRAALDDQDIVLLVAEDQKGPVGTIRFDRNGPRSEVSVTIAPTRRGERRSRALIQRGTERVGGTVDAYVKPSNEASRRAFEAAGYRLIDGGDGDAMCHYRYEPVDASYYRGREQELSRIFGCQVRLDAGHVIAGDQRWPVVDDVIVTLPPDRLPPRFATRLGVVANSGAAQEFAPDIQSSFGEEWTHHNQILDEHLDEFRRYFDLVDVDGLRHAVVADLGCGSGRWASFVAPRCRTVVVCDFSDALLVARDNLRRYDNVIYVLGDVLQLPFGADAFDIAYCLGVLHHLPVDALEACRRLSPFAPELLVYLYYALDNRPAHFRLVLAAVTAVRRQLARVTDRRVRDAATWLIAVAVYLPLSRLGRVLPAKVGKGLPLADTYGRSTIRRMRQDVEDRFFTGIEQRFRRDEILALRDTFGEVVLSDGLPYWHFLLRR